mmetsp:Transcript_111093/g.344575  ORF Transcript_111093/g.344575 Transcript_111093/m.344575 type:complete len:264 (-) Transcript_111093:2-793(-)
MAPTAWPAREGRSRERSRKGSSRKDTWRQLQQSVAAQRCPRKLPETQRPQRPVESNGDGLQSDSSALLRSAMVVSSETEPRRVRRSSCASCCSLPRYQGNREISCSRSALGQKVPFAPWLSSAPRMPRKTVQREPERPSRPSAARPISSSLKGSETLRHWSMLFMKQVLPKFDRPRCTRWPSAGTMGPWAAADAAPAAAGDGDLDCLLQRSRRARALAAIAPFFLPMALQVWPAGLHGADEAPGGSLPGGHAQHRAHPAPNST